jgi:hypothetical protein
MNKLQNDPFFNQNDKRMNNVWVYYTKFLITVNYDESVKVNNAKMDEQREIG